MAEVRSASVVVSAKLDQYKSEMAAAAKATESVADAADRAGRSVGASSKSMTASSGQVSQASQKVTDARRQEEDAAAKLNTAEKKLDEVKKNSTSTTSQVAKAEEQVITSRNRLEKATEGVEAAEKSYAKATAGSSKSVDSFSKSVQDNASEMSTAGKALTVFGAGIVGAGVAAGKSGVEFNNLKQVTGAAMKTLTGSTAEANAQMDKLNEFGSNSWIMRDVLLRAQSQMVGFGISTEKVIPYMDGLQEAVAATGGSSQQFEELAFVMAKVESRGKLTANTFNEFGMRGVDAATIIGEQMGKTAEEIRSEVTAGTLDATEALDALAEGMKTKYDGASDNVRDTFRGAIDDVLAGWRDLSAEMVSPLVDPDGGGLGVTGLNIFSDALRATADQAANLPDAVKIAVGAMGGLAGVGSLAAGGFLLLAPRVLETKKAFDTLAAGGGILGKTTRGMGRMAKAAGIAAGALVVLGAASAVANQLSETVKSTSEMENSLRQLSSQSGITKESFNEMMETMGSGGAKVSDFGYAVETLDMGGFMKTLDWVGSGFGFFDSDVKLAEQSVANIDQALVGFATSGNWGDLTDTFNAAAASMEDYGYSADDLIELLPDLKGKLIDQAEAMGLSTDNATLLKIATGEIEPPDSAIKEGFDGIDGAAEGAAESVADLVEQFNVLSGVFISSEQAQIDYEQRLDDITDSIKENGRTLDNNTQAGRDNREQLLGLAEDGWDLVEANAEAGKSTETLTGNMQDMYDDLVSTGKRMGMNADEAKDYARELIGIPEDVPTDVFIEDVAKALQDANTIDEAVQGIKDKTIGVKLEWYEDRSKLSKLQKDNPGARIPAPVMPGVNPGGNKIQAPKQEEPKFFGGIDLMPMAAGGVHSNIAEMVKPNTWRVVGDRMDVDEAFIPLDGSKRSWKIMMEALTRMPGIVPMASGGIVGRAESRLASAQHQLDSINNASRKVTAEDRRKDAAQKRVDEARAAVDRAKETQSRRERVVSLQGDLRTDVRRGNIRDQVTGGLSGGYSAVDRMFSLGSNEDLSKGSRSKASAAAKKFEANLKNLYSQAEKIDAKLKDAQDKATELKGIKDSVANGLLGDRGVDVGDYQNFTGGQWETFSGVTGATRRLTADVGAMKSFAGKLKKLAEAGIPGAIIQEIAQAGVAEGSTMADAFLDASKAEQQSYIGAWNDYEKYANQAGQYVTEGFHKGGSAAADGVVKGLEGKQKNVESAIANLAKTMESTFKQVLGIHSPSRVMSDLGGFTAEGLVQGMLGGVSDVRSAADALGMAAVPNAMAFDVTATPVVDDDMGQAGLVMQDMSATTLESMALMQEAVAAGWGQILANTQDAQTGMLEGTQVNQTGMLTALQSAQLGMLTTTQANQAGMLLDTQAKQASMLLNTQTQQEAMRSTVSQKQTDSRVKLTAEQEQMRATTAQKQSATRDSLTSEQESMRSVMADKQSRMRVQNAADFESMRSTTGAKLSSMRSNADGTMSAFRSDYSGHLSSLKSVNRSGFESMLDTSDANMKAIRSGMDSQMKGARPELGGNLNRLIDVFASFTASVNKAFGDVGVKLEAPGKVAFASGGVMPGYTPGRDVHQFRSPTAGELHLSGGEAIMRPEWTRAMGGEQGVKAQNDAARQGRLDDLLHSQQAFATGGVFGRVPGVNAFADSGVWRNLWAITKEQFPNASLNSAYRGGSITASGNTSHHSRGNAIDVSPSMDIFNFWRNKYGANLAELIYSPANGKQIKNGQNHMYTGAVRGMHFNHVHIAAQRALSDAMAGGLPGMGGAMSHPFLDRAGVSAGSNLQASYGKAAEKLTQQIYAKHSKMLPDGIAGQLGKGIMSQVSEGLVGKAKEYGKTTAISGTTAGDPAVKAAVRKIAEQMGWGDQWGDIDWLVNKESGWNPKAANPNSTARGLFQKMTSLHGPVEDTVEGQARWGLNYIKNTYGDPAGARRKHERSNWYEGGTDRAKNGLAVVGEKGPELVNFKGGEQVTSTADSMKFMAANRTYIPSTGGSAGIDYDALAKAVVNNLPPSLVVNNDNAGLIEDRIAHKTVQEFSDKQALYTMGV